MPLLSKTVATVFSSGPVRTAPMFSGTDCYYFELELNSLCRGEVGDELRLDLASTRYLDVL